MKPSLNQIINLIILLAVAFLCLRWGWHQKAEKQRYKSSLEAEVLYRDQEKNLNIAEAKHLYKIIDTLQKKMNLRDKEIQRVIQYEIIYRDTGSTKITQRPGDTVLIYPDSITGRIEKKCYTMDILLYQNNFYGELSYRDEYSVILYRNRPHKFWFIHYGKWKYKAALYSQCQDSIYQSFNNIVIQK
jgi:hypothetical protein